MFEGTNGDMSATSKEQQLTEEAMSILGMVAEIRSKCILFKEQVKREKERLRNEGGTVHDSVLAGEVTQSVQRMKDDLRTYSLRLKSIYNELGCSNGKFS